MSTLTGARHKLYVSPTAPATFDSAGYAAIVDWEITNCVNELPEIAKSYGLVSFECLFTGTTDTARGVAEAIEWDVMFRDGETSGAAGMTVIKTAFDATPGTAAELISAQVRRPDDSVLYNIQFKVLSSGYGSITVGEFVMRSHRFAADAITYVEG